MADGKETLFGNAGLMRALGGRQWFVMRDLTRSNALRPAYLLLEQMGVKNFTPMTWKIFVRNGVGQRRYVPVIHDLLFVYETREALDLIVGSVATLQYRFLRNAYMTPMTVSNDDMERFIVAVEGDVAPRYYRPEEITPAMYNRRIRIIGGRLNGYEGCLLTTRGSKVKRVIVELPSLLVAAVEVKPEYIQLI